MCDLLDVTSPTDTVGSPAVDAHSSRFVRANLQEIEIRGISHRLVFDRANAEPESADKSTRESMKALLLSR